MLLIAYINLVWYEWEMLRCCQLQSSPLFTNSLRSIDAGLLRGNDNINQSWRHNGPNQAEITGNVTMSYVCAVASNRAADSLLLSAGCAPLRKSTGEPDDSTIAPLIFSALINLSGVKTLSILFIFSFFFFFLVLRVSFHVERFFFPLSPTQNQTFSECNTSTREVYKYS